MKQKWCMPTMYLSSPPVWFAILIDQLGLYNACLVVATINSRQWISLVQVLDDIL